MTDKNDTRTAIQEAIIALVAARPGIGTGQLAKALDRSPSTVRRECALLEAAGVLEPGPSGERTFRLVTPQHWRLNR